MIMNIARFISLSSILRRNNVYSYSQNGLRTCSNLEKYIMKQNEIRFRKRHVSTCEIKGIQEEGLIKKALKKISFFNFDKLRITATAYLLYEGIADQLDYVAIFEELELPDTFYSWFVITELYIWMLSVRAMSEGTDGRHLRNGLVEALWLDVAQRVKKLGGISTTVMKEQVFELSEQLQAVLIAYDEGIQSNDTVLAGALWRRFYKMEHANPENLAELVKYIRKQLTFLDNVSWDEILKKKHIRWEPIKK